MITFLSEFVIVSRPTRPVTANMGIEMPSWCVAVFLVASRSGSH